MTKALDSGPDYYIMAYDADNTYYSDGPFATEEHALKDLHSWAQRFYNDHEDQMTSDEREKAQKVLSLLRKGTEDSGIFDHGRDTQYMMEFAGMNLEVYTSL